MDKSPDAFRTISEVADLLETPAHVLRFWESRFPQIKPVKRAGGRRYYRPADVALLAGIRQLLHQDGMTIRGVQKVLRDQGVRHVIALSDPHFDGPLDETAAEGEALDAAASAHLTHEDAILAPEVEAPSSEPDGADKVVALTDWRQAPDMTEAPMPAAPVADLMPQTEAELEALVELALSTPVEPPHEVELTTSGTFDLPTSLSAPLSEVSAEDDEPLQWSLFDMDQPSPRAAPAPEAPVAALSAEPLADMSLTAEPLGAVAETAGATADLDSAPLADAEARTNSDEDPAPEPEILPEPISEAGAEAALPPLEAPEPTAERPWLPPRLRALKAREAPLPREELLTLLARARALLSTLRDAS